MKAVVLEKYQEPLRLTEVPEPLPAHGEVAVRLTASGLNHLDERVRTGSLKALQPITLPKVMGSELSGTVTAIGDGVSGLGVGDAVIAYLGVQAMGSLAETIVVRADTVAPVPEGVDLTAAAGLPVVGLTAWQGLVGLGGLRPGQRVLIHGGAGGVGSVAVQVAAHLGAHVIATASARDAEKVLGLGAEEVIDYRSQDFAAELAGVPVDVVLNTQGDDVTLRSMQVLRRGGTVIGIAGTPEPTVVDRLGAHGPRKALLRPALAWMLRRLRAEARRRGVTYRFLFIAPDGEGLREVSALAATGAIRSVVDRVLPFEQALEALDQLLVGGAPRARSSSPPPPPSPTGAERPGASEPPGRVPPMTIIAAADGSALGNPGPAGWAWYVDESCWAAGGWPESTNNRGELTALLELLRATAHTGEDLLVQTDSQYVINSVTKWMKGWKRRGWRKADGKPVLNDDLMKAIDAALVGRTVRFEWVKGHAGHPANERADDLARAAATAFQRRTAVPSGPGWTRGGAAPEQRTVAESAAAPGPEDDVVPGSTAARRAALRAQQDAEHSEQPAPGTLF